MLAPASSPVTQTAGAVSAGQPAPVIATREGVLPCLADVAETDLAILPMDSNRRTDRTWSSGQPRAGLLAMQFEDLGGIRGGVKFATLASAAGVDIVGVYDAACQPVSTYASVSDPSQPKDHPRNYETMRYQIGDFVWVYSKLDDGRPFGFPLSTTSRRKRSYMSDHEAPLAHGNPKGLTPL